MKDLKHSNDNALQIKARDSANFASCLRSEELTVRKCSDESEKWALFHGKSKTKQHEDQILIPIYA